MFESCQKGGDSGDNSSGPRCAEVAEKLAQLFGWRQTYKVEKLQRSLAESVGRRVQFAVPPPVPPKQHKQRSSDSWVVVHNLQSQSDGGILDPDDRLNDVADDREQIIANFEDGDGVHHGGGDGASGSSVGTNSPDMFQGENHSQYPGLSRTDIEVTGQQLGSGLLQVRRGSEPALNQLIPTTGNNAGTGGGNTGVAVLNTTPDPSKRWSATPIIVDDADDGRERRTPHRKESTRGTRLVNGRLSAEWCQEQDEEEKSAFSRFVRDGSNRLSMQFLGESAGGLRWADAAERANAIGRGQSKSLPRDHRRKEPLGQATSNSPVPQSTSAHDSDLDEELASNSVEYVVLHNESGPLGIHVVPDYDRHGKDRGLLVQGIEPGGRIDRDGRLAVYDRIIEINGKNLLNMPFQRVQEIFKGSLLSPELRLRVIKHRSTSSGTSTAGELLKKPPAPVFPRSISRTLDEPVAMVEGEERLVSMSTKVAMVSPTKKVSPAHPATRATSSLLTANTRKIGKKIELELTKGPHGLGFSITTRDNPAGGNCPIYIKNILPKGAAVEDGRLKPGDRLLEVNGVEMTGKTQSEAVTVLRNAPPGSKVRIVVSRQEESGASSPRLPRQIVPQESSSVTPTISATDVSRDGSTGTRTTSREPPEKVNDDALVYPWKHKEIFTFDIPVHDTEKAGLGVSVKGKTSASHGVQSPSNGSSAVDLGIFVKSVLHGGAASRDGRLKTNDQLLNVNGISLLGQSNSDAMETLRRAMLHTEGPIPGVITLTIARRGGSPGPPGLSNGHQHHQSGRDSVSSLLTSSSGTETFGGKSEGEGYTPDNSGASENSDNTVIFLPYSHKEEEIPDVSTKPSGKMNDAKNMGNHEPVSARNPVIDRLTGQITNPHALRNESYYRATNETWNTTMLLSGTTGDKLCSPTVNQPSGEMVLIEEEYGPQQMSHKHRVGKPVLEKAPSSKRSDAEPDGQPGTRIPSDQSSEVHGTDITYASQLSLEETAAGFSRDAFGRQSMSEKRHATLDAKHTDTYQRNKKLREERERQRHMQFQQQQLNDLKRAEMTAAEAKANRELMVRANSIESLVSLTRSQADSEKSDIRCRNEFGPSLGMKKSSSLESLQTMVQEIQMQEDSDPAYTYRNAQGVVRVIRGRGCNESFRAAVDRSYDAPLAELRSRIEMETYQDEAWPRLFQNLVAEEDGVAGNPPDHVATSGTIADTRAFGGVRGGPRQSSLNSALDGKHKASKKKQGLLRGIGSMFRFGKHRKTLDVPMSLDLRSEDEMGNGPGLEEEQDGEREAARKAAQEEQQRIQEQYRRLMQRQRQMESNSQNTNNAPHEHGSSAGSSDGGSPAGIHHREGSTSSSSAGMPPSQSRTERIHQLRAQHQRRHAERRGQYPMDDREERYEEVIRQRLEQPETSHGRAASYDLYGEMARPGSRVGITDPAKFSHYVNYEEIQQHLNKRKEHLSEIQIMQMRLQVQRQRYKVEEESRRQQHYHSQRRDNRESHRPVSNFYEYESVQTVMRTSQQQRPGPALAMDSNSNSLPRRGQQDRTIVGNSSNNSNCSNNNNGGSSYTQQQQHQQQQQQQQQQQRLFQSSCTSGNNGPGYQPSTRTGSNNANNVNHLRAGHTHDVAHGNHSAAVPLVHNVPQGSRNIGLGTKVNNLTGRTQGPFVTQVMISQQPHPQTPGSKV